MSGVLQRMAAAGGIRSPRIWTPLDIPLSSRLLFLDGTNTAAFATSGGSTIATYTSPEGMVFNGLNAALNPSGLNGTQTVDIASGYLTSTAAAAAWKALHDGTLCSVHMGIKPGNIPDPNAVYGLFGTGSSSTMAGTAMTYDDRLSSARNNRANVSTFVKASGQSSISTNLATSEIMLPNQYQVFSVLLAPGAAVAASRCELRLNDGAAVKNNVSAAAPSTSDPDMTLQIGAMGGGVLPFVGGYSFVVILSGSQAHSVDLRERIAGWFAHTRYRLPGQPVPLGSSHPYFLSPPLA